jgi:hypothetical protein
MKHDNDVHDKDVWHAGKRLLKTLKPLPILKLEV